MAIYLFVDKSKNEFSLAPAVARIDNLGNVAALHKVFEYGKLLLLAAGNGKLPILRDNGEIVILPFSVLLVVGGCLLYTSCLYNSSYKAFASFSPITSDISL